MPPLRSLRNGVGLLLLGVQVSTAQDATKLLLDADHAVAQLSSDSGFAVVIRQRLDGPLLWPGAPIVSGAEDLKKFLRLHPLDSLRLAWQPLGVTLAADSAFGVTWGVAVSSSRISSAAPRLGRYLAAWKRNSRDWTLASLLLTGIETPSSHRSWPGLKSSHQAASNKLGRQFVAADLAFSRLAGDSGAAVAFRTYADEQAMSFGGSALLVRGAAAISRAVAGPEHWRWYPVAAGETSDATMGWTVGEAVIAGPEGDPAYSKYLTIWTRSEDGRIRFLYDGGNARPAAP
jgi:hypothetical protein